MNDEAKLEQLLRWRLKQAEADAPPAPRAAVMLARLRPWWEALPEQGQAIFARLLAVQVAYGHAKDETAEEPQGHPVIALLLRGPNEILTSVQILYFSLRGDALRLRFKVSPDAGSLPPVFSGTLVSENSRPLALATAELAAGGEYRIEFELPVALADAWSALKARDRMPFRFVLGPMEPAS